MIHDLDFEVECCVGHIDGSQCHKCRVCGKWINERTINLACDGYLPRPTSQNTAPGSILGA